MAQGGRRKRNVTLLLRPDHTARQTLTHKPMKMSAPGDSAGKI
jgi:hypothetical protein